PDRNGSAEGNGPATRDGAADRNGSVNSAAVSPNARAEAFAEPAAPAGQVPDSPRSAEVAILNAVQSSIGANPAVVSVARGMSHFGEHALGWVGVAAAGWLVDK